MDFVALLRCTTAASGEQCVMIIGIAWMPKLFAGSLGTVAALHIQAEVKARAVAIFGWMMWNVQVRKVP